MKVASKKSAPKKSPFMAINKKGLQQIKGGALVIVDMVL